MKADRVWIYGPGEWSFSLNPFARGGDECGRHTLCIGFGGWCPVLVVASRHVCRDLDECDWTWRRSWVPQWPYVKPKDRRSWDGLSE